jgi:hypothetical protein
MLSTKSLIHFFASLYLTCACCVASVRFYDLTIICRLSAYLASVSSDKTAYINAATAAANWMKNADKNTTSDLILDTVNS